MKKYRFPSQGSEDPEEKHLGALLRNYTSNRRMDQEFVKLLREKFNWSSLIEKFNTKGIKLLNYCVEHGFRPSVYDTNAEIRELAVFYNRISCDGIIIDKDFKNKIMKFPSKQSFKRQKKYNRILQKAKNGEKRPHYSSSDGEFIDAIQSKLGGQYKGEWVKELHSLRPDWFRKGKQMQVKEAILKFIREYGRRPNKKDKENYDLYIGLKNRCSPSSHSYDLEFKKQVDDLCKELGI